MMWLIGLVVLIIVLITGFYLITPSSTPVAVACPLDTQKCSDGSFVSRSGPACEFAACPTSPVVTPPAPVETESTTALLQQQILTNSVHIKPLEVLFVTNIKHMRLGAPQSHLVKKLDINQYYFFSAMVLR